MRNRRLMLLTTALVLAGCGDSPPSTPTPAAPAPASAAASVAGRVATPAPSGPVRPSTPRPSATVRVLPSPGNPSGGARIPADARPVDTGDPDRTIGDGTPASCTSAAVVEAVARGGIITFDCGPAPVTITMRATAKVRNTSRSVVLDGGGRVTLSGGGKRRILYQNTCDRAQGWTTSHCDDQETPRLTLQNLALADGDSTGQSAEGGGGAVLARGGRLRVINSRFTGNRCDRTGPDVGGAAVRALDQSGDRPVYVVRSTFSGGACANGGALSSIGVSWSVLNSVFTGNAAVGRGANPARGGTPGGGSGGAIYLDGNDFSLRLEGTVIEDNRATEGGGAVFFVSNDRTGTLTIRSSLLRGNRNAGFETAGLPGIFYLGRAEPTVSGSTLRR